MYKLTAIEVDEDGETYTTPYPWVTRDSLADLVRVAHKYGWIPGKVSVTGLTIVETIIEST
jgi:hypothetical protein